MKKNKTAEVATFTSGNDNINGTDQADTLDGLEGNDTIAGLAGADSISGSAGLDSLSGGDGNDTLIGGKGKDTLVGGSGHDSLDGGDANDTLLAGGGNDTLQGGPGADSLAGANGNDLYIVDNLGDVIDEVTNGGGTDTVESSVSFADSHPLPSNVEQLQLTGTADLAGFGNAVANQLTGNDGNNELAGQGGNDTLAGGLGDDTLNGGDGDDVLQGGSGSNSLDGGDGSDTAVYGGARVDYDIQHNDDGTWSVQNGNGDTDQLANIEIMAFADGSMDLNDLPQPTLSVADIALNEGNSGSKNAVFTLTLSDSPFLPVTVAYASSDETALAGSDYLAVSGSVTFQPGETSKTVKVPVIPDTTIEADETFTLQLGNASGADLAVAEATATLLNDDKPTLSIADATITEGDSGSSNVSVRVTLSGAAFQPVSVKFATGNISALAGSDYTAKSGTLTFNPGETDKTITIAVLGDTISESSETFKVTLSNPVNALLGGVSKATVTIADNDIPAPPPVVSIATTTVTEGDSGSSDALLTVSLSAASSKTVTVAYATADGTATAGSDYLAATGTLTFAPGETSKTISVSVTGDTSVENDETLQVSLSSPSNASLSDSAVSATLTIRNDDVDRTSPALVSSTPADDATGVAASQKLVLVFDEPVQAGAGNIVIGNGVDIRTITVADISQVSIDGSTVTIDPAVDLLAGNDYSVQIDDGAIQDMAGNAYPGIGDATSLNFAIGVAAASAINLSTLDGAKGFRLDGAVGKDYSGYSVSSAGDVNGDGFDDLIVGAPDADPNGKAGAGSSYVVFGQAAGFAATVKLSSLDGSTGFRLDGAADGDASGMSVSSAGDVNGDGFGDLIVGAPESSNASGKSYAGASYVVFGQASGFAAAMDVSSVDGSTGFRLDGAAAGDRSGGSVSSAGDVNGDGFGDLIVGAPGADPNGKSYAGSSYVVFGQAAGGRATVDLATLDGTAGFRLDGAAAGDISGYSVSSAGDVNGDGFGDLIVGAKDSDPNGKANAGASYVVFGQASGFASAINLSGLDGSTGFRLAGAAGKDYAGASVSSAGDVNGDGFDDLIVGAPDADPNGKSYAGSSYVVFGQAAGFAATVDLAALDGTTGFRLDGAAAGDVAGYSVSSAGDVNGDGFDDLIVGAEGSDASGKSAAGSSYVVFGQASGFASAINLSGLDGSTGFRLDGVAGKDYSAASVSAAGDVNGDGFDDLIVGAPDADPNGKSAAGSSYVVFGSNFTGSVTYLGSHGADTAAGTAAAERFVAGSGNDSITGGGGADVINGGQGDDTFSVTDLNFHLLDGGNGSDTLALSGAGLNLDLAAQAGQIENIERIDLTGTGDNALALTPLDVLNLSDSSNRLTIDGDSGDTVSGLAGGWTDGGSDGGYHTYSQGQATLLVGVNVVTDYPQA